jgi:hypothetical protein
VSPRVAANCAGRSATLRRALLAALLLLSVFKAAHAQQPFVTDDADVTDKGKLHLQIGDEYDLFQRALYPAKTQNTFGAELSYGVWKNVEIGFAPGWLALRSARVVSPQTVSGVGDSTLHVKYNFL